MTDKLIVCTETASFMGGVFDTKEMWRFMGRYGI